MSSDNVTSAAVFSNYPGLCEHSPLTNENIFQIARLQYGIIHGPSLFALKYRMLPCTLTRSWDENDKQSIKNYKEEDLYHATSILHFLADEYKVDPNSFLYKHTYNIHNKSSAMSIVYIDLNNHLAVLLSDGFRNTLPKDNPNGLKPDGEGNIFHCFSNLTIYHAPQTASQAKTLLEKLCQFTLYNTTQGTFQMVCHDRYIGYYTKPIEMKKPEITDLNLYYGDEFSLIHEGLVDILQEKDSTGITMFHGPPGTGKTNYLRYLINEIQDKELIYVPPDLVNNITTPDFLPFLMKHPNSIIIIEDAENIILDRKANSLSTQAVSNILNLSDGLLGDAIHQQIICTFNCDVQSIDPALRREGRLVLEHKFDKLSVENARRLCVELGIPGNGEDIHEPKTLSEIYERKNATESTSTGNDDVNNIAAKIQRLFKIKRQKSNTFLHLYS